MTIPFIQVKNVSKQFLLKKKRISALSNVSFNIYRGETLGMVGESGSGKTTMGKLLIKTLMPTSGDIFFQQESLSKTWRKNAQVIFQNPYSSLDPRMRAFDIVEEPLIIHRMQGRREKVFSLFENVGLDPSLYSRFPHELSGGQRQRLSIARTLALSPEFIVCDEPTSSLDVSIQAQIINLLKKLQADLGLTYFFISHDLRLVRKICSRIIVLYQGEIVEIADTETLFSSPQHPYTKELLMSL